MPRPGFESSRSAPSRKRSTIATIARPRSVPSVAAGDIAEARIRLEQATRSESHRCRARCRRPKSGCGGTRLVVRLEGHEDGTGDGVPDRVVQQQVGQHLVDPAQIDHHEDRRWRNDAQQRHSSVLGFRPDLGDDGRQRARSDRSGCGSISILPTSPRANVSRSRTWVLRAMAPRWRARRK